MTYTFEPVRPSVTIVIPIHNEAAFLPTALPLLWEELEMVPADWDLLLVENGSTDRTAEVAAEMTAGWSALVIRHPEADYGASMRAGFLAARGEWVVNFDVDYFSGAFLAKALAEGADIVIASKRDPASDDRRSVVRRLATFTFNMLLKVMLNSGVSDTHGMKLFSRQVIQQLAGKVVSRKDLFDTELVLRAERAGFRIAEVPVVVEEMRVARSSLLKRAPRTIKGLLAIRQTFAAEQT